MKYILAENDYASYLLNKNKRERCAMLSRRHGLNIIEDDEQSLNCHFHNNLDTCSVNLETPQTLDNLNQVFTIDHF